MTQFLVDGNRLEPIAAHQVRDADASERSDWGLGTRSHYGPGAINLGGPYAGFEGLPVTFMVSPSSPDIVFFRYDFDGDGDFDYPDQTGCGSLTCWTTETWVQHTYEDDFSGDLVVEGWDGISDHTTVETGNNLNQETDFQWFLGYGGYNFAWHFTAKKDVRITRLGAFHFLYPLFDQAIWTSTGTMLGSCTPVHENLQWNWCTLSSPITITMGSEYRISIRSTQWTTGINSPADTDYVSFGGTYYCFSPLVLCFPGFFMANTFIPQIDFEWEKPYTAAVGVSNVAPAVLLDSFETPTPDPYPAFIIAGESITFHGSFADPGSLDTHTLEWGFGDPAAGYVSGTQDPTYAYSSAGTFTVTFKVTDDDGGFDTAITTVTVSTPQDQLGTVVGEVQQLVDSGALTAGQGNALKTKLNTAIDKLNQGNMPAACGKLKDFADQVNALINSGTISSAEGQPLIDMANATRAAIGC